MVVLAFIFSSSLEAIDVQLLKMNCPYPVFSADVNNVNINGTQVTYEIVYNTTFANDIFVFNCGGDNLMSVSVTYYDSVEGFFALFDNAFAWIGYVYFSILAFFGKVVAFGSLIFLVVNAPAVVTGLAFFSYINLVLLSFIGLGAFMVVRG